MLKYKSKIFYKKCDLFSTCKVLHTKEVKVLSDFLCTDEFLTDTVNEYSDTIYRIAFNITKNPDDAFDVCQDVFVRLIKNKHKIKNKEHLKSWLLRTAINCAKSNCTQAYKRHYVSIGDVKESSFAQNDTHNSLVYLLMKLPEKYRTIIHLFYYEDLKIAEIAKLLGITQSAAKSRLSRGREKLKIILEKENYYG